MRVRQLHFGDDQEFEPGRVVAALALRGAAAAPTPQKPPQSGTPHAADADSRTSPLPPAERPVYNPPRPSPTALREQNPVPNPPSPTAHWPTTDLPLRQQVTPGAGAVILNAGRAGTLGGPAAHAKSLGHCLREALQGGTEAVAILVGYWGLNRLQLGDGGAIEDDNPNAAAWSLGTCLMCPRPWNLASCTCICGTRVMKRRPQWSVSLPLQGGREAATATIPLLVQLSHRSME
jgi:hypothetical protein